jgi:hypothetical protein
MNSWGERASEFLTRLLARFPWGEDEDINGGDLVDFVNEQLEALGLRLPPTPTDAWRLFFREYRISAIGESVETFDNGHFHAGPEGDPEFRLHFSPQNFPFWVHFWAVRVTRNQFGEQVADLRPGVDYSGGFAELLNDLYQLDDTMFETVTLAGEEYVVFATPHGA